MSEAPRIYLDYNATAPVRPSAVTAAREAMAAAGNPSSVHEAGRRSRALIERARGEVGALVGVDASRIVFTSGGTEANALAILGAVQAGIVSRLIISAIEHPSVAGTARLAAERHGIALDVVRVMPDGVVDLAHFTELLSQPSPLTPPSPRLQGEGDRVSDRVRGVHSGATLVSIMAANNETGVVQPLAEIAVLARAHGALLHTDATQIAGRLPFDASPFDFVTLSAHKLGGLGGAGALIVRDRTMLAPLCGGGRQEEGLRPGTEATHAIAAFGAAAREASDELGRAGEHARWRDAMEARLIAAVPGLKVYGAGAPRLPQTSCLGLAGTAAETQVIALDLAHMAVSAGAACSSGKVHASAVLSAMGASAGEARSAIRVSFGWATRESELHQFTDVWVAQLARSAQAHGLILRQAQDEAIESLSTNQDLMLSLSKHEENRREVVA